MDELLGRGHLLHVVERALGPGATVALYGRGGIGKSAIARAVLAGSSAPVCVDVSAAADADAVSLAVARALDLSLGTGGPALDATIGAALGARSTPIALDGATIPVAGPIAAWRAETPGLRVLVTCRDPAGHGGVAVEVPPLPRDAALTLLRRAGASTAGDAELAPLVDALDGLPLALEYAGAAIGVLGVAGVLELVRTAGLPPVDALLAAAIDGLPADTRAALAVLAAPGVDLDPTDLRTLVPAGLVEHLLALRRAGLVSGHPRTRVLPSVREFLRRRGALRTEAWVEAAFSRVARAEAEWERCGDPSAHRELVARELATLDALVSAPPGPERARLVLSLEAPVTGRGPYAVLLGLVEREPPCGRPDLDARLARLRAELLAYCGRPDEAATAIERAEALARAACDPALVARALIGRGWIALHHDRRADALSHFASARAAAAALTDRQAADHQLAHAWMVEGAVHRQLGDFRRLAESQRRAARHAHAAGCTAFEALALRGEGDATGELGDSDRAVALLREALALGEGQADRRARCLALGSLGAIELDRGRTTEARAALEECLELAALAGDRRLVGLVAPYLGLARAWTGDADGALAAFDVGVAAALRVDNVAGRAFCVALRGALHAREGRSGPAGADVASGEALAAETDQETLQTVVAVCRSAVHRAEARAAAAAGDVVRARQRLRQGAETPERWSELAARTYDVRLALRLRDEVSAALPEAGPAPAPTDGLRIAEDASWFELDGAKVDLQSRGAQRRILAGLVRARVDGAGEVLGIDALFAEGWPGERALPKAARNRVYSALYALRGLGLEGWIVRRDEGWCLDPTRPVAVTPA